MKNANKKQLALVLNPLERIAKATEVIQEQVTETNVAISINLKKAAEQTHKELKTHTTLLTEIRDLLRTGKKEKGGIGSKLKGRFKMPNAGSFATAAFAIVGISAALLLSAGVLSVMPTPNPMQLLTAVAIVGLFALILPSFIKLTRAIQKAGYAKAKWKGGDFSFKSAMSVAGVASLALVGIAVGIALSSWVFKLITPIQPAQFLSALAISVIMTPIALSFGYLIRGIAKSGIKMNPSGLGVLGMAAIAMPMMAIGIVGAAFIFANFMPSVSASDAPPMEWTLKAGAAILAFSIPFTLIAVVIKKAGLGIKELGFGLLGVVAVAIGVMATAWIFSALPGEYYAPPLDWAMKAAISLTAFSIPVIILGLIASSGVGAAGILLGAVGVILLAGVVWAVAWIFSKLPTVDVGAMDALSRGLMSPIHAMIDVLKRFKDEIGVENMLGLAGGIVMISGAWLTLVAALAGQAVGGVVSSLGNAVSGLIDGFASFFGADKPDTPIDILDKLLNRGKKILVVAEPLAKIGTAFLSITGTAGDIIKAMIAIKPLTDPNTSSILDANARSFNKIATAYTKIGEASHSLNIKGIQASTEMFNALARLAEADGDDAMTTMAKRLMEAVKELSEVVNNLEGVMQENGEESKGLLQKMGSKFEEAITGSAKEVKKLAEAGQTVNVDMGPVISALNEIEERLNMPLTVVVDDAI